MIRRLTRTLLAGLAVGGLLWGLSEGRSLHKAITIQQACADALGIAYDPQEGATEKLTAFQACIQGCLEGREVIFYPPTGKPLGGCP